MPQEEVDNGWGEWQNFVLEELKRLNKNVEALSTNQQDTRIEIAKLKIKSGLWGAVAGMLPATGTLVYLLLRN